MARTAKCPKRLGARRLWAAAALAVLLALFGASAEGVPAPSNSPADEEFFYDIRFLWLEKVAKGILRIRRTGENRYRAELLAETRGFASLLTSDQKNYYVSEMEYDPRERRLLTRRYTQTIYHGKEMTRTVSDIDYERRQIRWKTWGTEQPLEEGIVAIPPGGRCEDILSAFFNFRLGAYGPLRPGMRATVPALPEFDPSEPRAGKAKDAGRRFEIRIPDTATEAQYRKRYGRTNEKGMLALVAIPQDFFGQKTGEIRLWLDRALTPVAATVENAILFGDVHGALTRLLRPGEKPARPLLREVVARPPVQPRRPRPGHRQERIPPDVDN